MNQYKVQGKYGQLSFLVDYNTKISNIKVSTQYGCNMKCIYCNKNIFTPSDKIVNCTIEDLKSQLEYAFSTGRALTSERVNIVFSYVGEATYNPAVIECIKWLRNSYSNKLKYILSTMMPAYNENLRYFINRWMHETNGDGELRILINSTDEIDRSNIFHQNQCTLEEISTIIMKDAVDITKKKPRLVFMIDRNRINPSVLLKYFTPSKYAILLIPLNSNPDIAMEVNQTTSEWMRRLTKVGYEVLGSDSEYVCGVY